MKNKKIKYKDLCQMVEEQEDQIQKLKQAINYIQNTYFCDTPFRAGIAYSDTLCGGEELRISYLKNSEVNTITYTLKNDFLSFPKIEKIVKKSDEMYIITLQRAKDYYESYGIDTSTWTIVNITSLIRSNN